jgi:hypothetical protein
MEHLFIGLMDFQKCRGVAPDIRMEELRLTAIGVPDERFECGVHQIRIRQFQILQGSIPDCRQIDQYGADGQQGRLIA